MHPILLIPFVGLALANRVPEQTIYPIETPGEYFWFPEKLDSRPCTIHFQLKATRDAVITFSPRRGLVDDIYQIVIGADSDRFLCVIRERGTIPALDQWARDILTGQWQDFFVQLCNGVIVVEMLDGNDRSTIARWEDPRPLFSEQWFVGITSNGDTSEWRIVNDESCGIDGGDTDVRERENRERENDNRRWRRREEQERRQRQREEEAARERQRIRDSTSGGTSRSPNNRRGSGTSRSSNNQRGSATNRSANSRRGSGTSRGSNSRRGSDSSRDPNNRSGSGTGGRSSNRRGSGTGRGSNSRRGSDNSRDPNNRRGSGTSRGSNNRRESESSNDRDRENGIPAQIPGIDERIQIDITGTSPDQWKQWKFVEDKLRSPGNYRFKFWVKAERDARIRVSSTNSDDSPDYYEIMIFFRGNNICIIRSGTNVLDKRSRNVLNEDYFVQFELGWDGRTITLWKDGRVLVEYTDRNPCTGLEWIGVTSYDPDNRFNPIDSWWIFRKDTFVSEQILYQINTPGEYFWFEKELDPEPCTIHFQVKATQDAVITFSPEKRIVEDIYEIVIGARGNLFYCLIRKNGTEPAEDIVALDILTGEWQDFWVHFWKGLVVVEKLDDNRNRITVSRWQDEQPLNQDKQKWYVGLTSEGDNSEWRIVNGESCGIDETNTDGEERGDEQIIRPRLIDLSDGTSSSPNDRRGSGTSRNSNNRRGSGTSRSSNNRRGSGTSRSSNNRRGSGTSRRSSNRRGSGTSRRSSNRRGSGTNDRSGSNNGDGQNVISAPISDNDETFQIDITGTSPNQWKQWKFVENQLRSPTNYRFKFWVKAERDAHIRVSSTRSDDSRDYYEIMISFRRTNICILRSGRNVEDEPFEDILDRNSFVEFELGWDGRKITLWKDGRVLVEFTDRNPCTGLDWIGVTSYDPDNRFNRIDSWWKFRKDTFAISGSGGENGRDGGSGGRRSGGRSGSSSRRRSSSRSGSRRWSGRRGSGSGSSS